MSEQTYQLQPVGWVESPLTDRDTAPKQGYEGAPLARIVFRPEFREAAVDLRVGDEVRCTTKRTPAESQRRGERRTMRRQEVARLRCVGVSRIGALSTPSSASTALLTSAGGAEVETVTAPGLPDKITRKGASRHT